MTKLEETRFGNLRQKKSAEKLTTKEQNWLKCLRVKKSVETETIRLNVVAQRTTIRMRQEHY
ncbi:MAG: hypothetical protein ACXW32_07380 [Limisphaerales bacterium]